MRSIPYPGGGEDEGLLIVPYALDSNDYVSKIVSMPTSSISSEVMLCIVFYRKMLGIKPSYLQNSLLHIYVLHSMNCIEKENVDRQR